MAKKGGNPQNLTHFKKGESGNPNGRPKGIRDRSTIVKYWLEAKKKVSNHVTGEDEVLEIADIITLSLIKEAEGGNVQAFKELMDSAHGKVVDKTATTDTKGNDLPNVFINGK